MLHLVPLILGCQHLQFVERQVSPECCVPPAVESQYVKINFSLKFPKSFNLQSFLRFFVPSSGYSMSWWVDQHQESALSVKLARKVLVQAGLQDGLLNCVVSQYDPEAVLEFWQNMEESKSDPHAIRTKVQGKTIRVTQKLLTEIFGFKTFGPEQDGDPSHTGKKRDKHIKKMVLNPNDPANPPKPGMKNFLYKKEYAELGGYFARAVWSFTSGNDEMSARKVDMVMIVDREENFDWGKYLVSQFKFYQTKDKLPLVYQIQKILDHVKVSSGKFVEVRKTRFKKESTNPSVRDLLSKDLISKFRQKIVARFAGADVNEEDDSGDEIGEDVYGDRLVNKDDDDVETEVMEPDSPSHSVSPKSSGTPSTSAVATGSATAQAEDSEHTHSDDDIPIVHMVGSSMQPKLQEVLQKREKQAEVVPGTLRDEDPDFELKDITEQEENPGGTSIHLDSTVFTPIEEDVQLYGAAKYIAQKKQEELQKAIEDDIFGLNEITAAATSKKRPGKELVGTSGKRQKKIARRSRNDRTLRSSPKSRSAPEDLTAHRKLRKECRRRIQELISYKLSHREILIPSQHLLDFEDWVWKSLQPFNFSCIIDNEQNRERIKNLIFEMENAIAIAASNGDIDHMMFPDNPVSDIDTSDEEFEEERVKSTAAGNTPRSSSPKPSVRTDSVSTEKLDAVLQELAELKSTVRVIEQKGVQTSEANSKEIMEVTQKIVQNVCSSLENWAEHANKFDKSIEEHIRSVTNDHELVTLVLAHFVGDANKGEGLDTPAGRDAFRRKLLQKNAAREEELRKPGIGRVILTEEIKQKFILIAQDPVQWARYKDLDFYEALELYLRELYFDSKISLWRLANSSHPQPQTYFDHVDEFQIMYFSNTFETDEGHRIPFDEAWRVYLLVTPGGLEFIHDRELLWYISYDQEWKEFAAMTEEEKKAYALKRLGESKAEKRKRVLAQLQVGDTKKGAGPSTS